jgi:hypothetical protein
MQRHYSVTGRPRGDAVDKTVAKSRDPLNGATASRVNREDAELRCVSRLDHDRHDIRSSEWFLFCYPFLLQPRIGFGCDALTQGAPTRTLSPVGAGTPPAGSIVTATATGEGMSGGVRNTPSARPDTSGSISPALIGPPGRTTHT